MNVEEDSRAYLINGTDEVLDERKVEHLPNLRPSLLSFGTPDHALLIWPMLTTAHQEILNAYWTSLHVFNPSMPNCNPQNPSVRARPSQIDDATWDWKDQMQPVRHFFCPCAVWGHECSFTGLQPMQCPLLHNICTRYVR